MIDLSDKTGFRDGLMKAVAEGSVTMSTGTAVGVEVAVSRACGYISVRSCGA